MSINSQIIRILKDHPEGGEKFFDALDYTLRGDMSIIDSFLDFVERRIGTAKAYSVVLTGEFGRTLINNKINWLAKHFSDILLVNGGIRKGAEVQLDCLPIKRGLVFIDDSFYSGTTRDSILDAINAQSSSSREWAYSFVIYDGSKLSPDDTRVKSMYRYYG